MIHTITLNPAVDYFMSMADGIKPGELNAAEETHMEAGGKGINCSIVLNNMGVASQMHALLGGVTGAYILDQISAYPHIHNCSVKITGASRINVKITGKEEYILNAPGPEVTKEELDSFLKTFSGLQEDDYVILSGKAPLGTPTTFLYDIADIVNDAGAKLILDTRDMRLEDLTYCQPWLIKPNLEELGDLLFSVVNLSRMAKIDPEESLNRATEKFIERFAMLEMRANESGKRLEYMSLEEMDALWNLIKNASC